jgi:hypothetical protein
MYSTKDPIIAMIALLDKRNTPILIKNYLAEQKAAELDQDFQQTLLYNQMLMVVYQALDLISEHCSRIKGSNEHRNNEKLVKETPEMAYSTNCFLGLLLETHVGEFELDVYGYVANTKYKYIIIKNEHHNTKRQLLSGALS